MRKEIGEEIRTARKKLGYSQKVLSEKHVLIKLRFRDGKWSIYWIVLYV